MSSSQQQPILFYSDRCPNCQQVIETLKGLGKTDLFRYVSVEKIPREQIPSYLTKVPTIFVPTTKDVHVGKESIFGYISKPTNSRKEVPVQEKAKGDVAPSQPITGDLMSWDFSRKNKLDDAYSMWDSPTSFPSDGSGMYTFISGNVAAVNPEPTTKNTISDKSGNGDLGSKLEAMILERKNEFANRK